MANNQINNEYVQKGYLKTYLANRGIKVISYDEWEHLCDCIDDAKAADVVEVVRCKDCKHYYFADNRIPQEQRYVCDLDGDRWKADSFCSFAERRTDATD